MRYLIFGDVHGNLPALDAVLAAGQAREIETYLFVGDLVGYGPWPVECIDRLMPLHESGQLAWVAGNHELVARGDREPEGYNAEAGLTLEWTRKLLKSRSDALKFLKSAEMVVEANRKIFLTHDSLAAPGSGDYHRWPQNAHSELACLRWHGGRVCFYGHTHMLRAEIVTDKSGLMIVPIETHEGEGRDPHPIKLAATDLGWIGVGSVGLPKNPQRRAEYLILDDATEAVWLIEKYSVAYPREKVREQTRAVVGALGDAAVAERIAKWF